MTIQMWTAAVRRAAAGWRGQAEGLGGPRRTLAQTEAGLLGSRVGPAAEAFLTTWEIRVRSLSERAERHADSLDAATFGLIQADAESVQRTQRLLLWQDRTTSPTGDR